MPTMYDLPSEDPEDPGKARRVSYLATTIVELWLSAAYLPTRPGVRRQ